MEYVYDTVIIGAGPAGMAAALYSSRANLKTLIIEKDLHGGQLQNTEMLDNYLGVPNVYAPDLADSMYEQALSFGAEEKFAEIKSIKKNEEKETFVLTTAREMIYTKTVIVATGTKYKRIGVPGEVEFESMGVSYCAICDGPFFQDKKVVVVGGGDSALEEADYLTQFADVFLVHRRNEYRAKQHLQDRIRNNPKITEILNAELLEVIGTKNMEKAKIKLKDTNSITNIDAEGCFVYVGQDPQTSLLAPFGVLDEEGYITVDESGMSTVGGLFAAGDIIQKKIRQVANAVGEGSVVGQSVYNYLKNKE